MHKTEEIDTNIEKEIEQKALKFLNDQLGSSAKNLHKIENIVQQLSTAKQDLEDKLQLLNDAAPDKVVTALKLANEKFKETENFRRRTSKLIDQVEAHNKKLESLIGCVQEPLDLIDRHEKVQLYHNWINSIEVISKEMSSSSCSETRLLQCYSDMGEKYSQIAGKTACHHLQQFTFRTLCYWHQNIIQTFSKEFENMLTAIHYPFINASVSQPSPSPENLERLKTLTGHLLMLKSPEHGPVAPTSHSVTSLSDNSSPNESFQSVNQSADLTDVPQVSSADDKMDALAAHFDEMVTPLQLLFKPLEIRFRYHFSGDKKTNCPSHPEWCLTRVLSWINSHSDFLTRHIQPVLNKCQYSHLQAKTEISRGLVKLVVFKLAEDIPTLMEDEDLFCHCLQETLNFERELRLSCGYPSSQPSVLIVLTQPNILSHWIQTERKYAVALMDELVSMPGAWDSNFADDCGEEDRVTSCGEHLVTLLQGITDRYKPLPQPGHRLQFLEVQLDVLDEFRIRAAQLSREVLQSPVNSHYPAILNTLRHVSDTLQDWGDMPMLLELQMYQKRERQLEAASEFGLALNQTDLTVDGGVFDSCIGLYTHMEEEMLETLRRHVFTDVKSRAVPYRRDKWFLEPANKKDGVHIKDVSGSLCPLLEVLVLQLHSLRKLLSSALFTTFWQALAKDIDRYLYEEVVLQNHFSELGAAQLQHDMNKALYPVFAEYTSNPQAHFPLMKECVTLLSLSRPMAMLLRDTLKLSFQDPYCKDVASSVMVTPAAALGEHKVTRLSVEQAFTVLNARTNMASF